MKIDKLYVYAHVDKASISVADHADRILPQSHLVNVGIVHSTKSLSDLCSFVPSKVREVIHTDNLVIKLKE